MNTRTFTRAAILGLALAVPAAASLAQPFGRDSVYAAPAPSGMSERTAAVRNNAQPNGRDTVFASRIEGAGRTAATAELTAKPGRG
jgi:hypothetical protein